MENPYDSPFTGEYGELMDEDLADIEAKGLRHEPELHTCECGWTTCGGGRGCGECGDCSGEHCECGLDVREPGELTCDTCVGYCLYRGDAYNTHGDCLAEK